MRFHNFKQVAISVRNGCKTTTTTLNLKLVPNVEYKISIASKLQNIFKILNMSRIVLSFKVSINGYTVFKDFHETQNYLQRRNRILSFHSLKEKNMRINMILERLR